MQQWEYAEIRQENDGKWRFRTDNQTGSETEASYLRILDQAGADGWEVSAAIASGLLLKRPVAKERRATVL